MTCQLVCTVLKWYLSIVTGTFSKVPIPSILYKICFIPVLKYPHQAYFIKFFRHMHKSTHTKHIYRISLVPVLKYPYKARFGSQFLRLVCVILNRYLKNFHEKMNFGEDVNIFRNQSTKQATQPLGVVCLGYETKMTKKQQKVQNGPHQPKKG